MPWPLLSSKPRPPRSTSKMSNTSATATSRCWRRIYKPSGAGPFPALVECHGGAWCMSDRHTEKLRHESMASHGIVSIALDFRSGNEDPYPASVQDINYAVRWAKANARALKTRPDLVGLSGQSSGGHLAMLVAMRPHDPRYAAIPLAGRLARAGRERALRDHVVAGDQSAQPLPPRQARRGERQSAGVAEVDHRPPRFLLAVGSQHGRGQPDDGARARREAADAARDLVPGARRHHARLQGRGIRRSTATSRSASAPRTARPAARSRWNTSTWSASPALRRTCPSAAPCSGRWWSSSKSM